MDFIRNMQLLCAIKSKGFISDILTLCCVFKIVALWSVCDPLPRVFQWMVLRGVTGRASILGSATTAADAAGREVTKEVATSLVSE